jgi:tripartite-type tricarboxylate transporter receptor subunit TctC
MRRKFLQAGLAMAVQLALGAGMAQAQDKPIEWVVGFVAGGGSDAVARTVAEAMGKTLNRSVIVNNKPGAGTNIAAEYVAHTRDVNNVMFTADFATLAANPWLFSKLNYNAERDFVPVGLLARFPLFLVVNNNVPVNNFREFLAWAKAQGGPINYATPGLGTPHHLATELLAQRVGLKVTHVPYKGGAAAIVDVIGGQVPFMLVDSGSVVQHIAAGKVRVIAVANRERLKGYPQVPTLVEQGVAGYEAYAWQGLVAPKGTSADVVQQWAQALQAALKSPAVLSRFDALALEPLPGTPAQMQEFWMSEREKWRQVIQNVGIKID